MVEELNLEQLTPEQLMLQQYPLLNIDLPKEFQYKDPGKGNLSVSYGKLVEALGSGATGDVYKIEFHPYNPLIKILGRYGAVKILDHTKLDERRNAEIISRFKREGRLGEALEPKEGEVQHPNLLRYPDHGSIGRNFYIIMEITKGRKLNDYINEDGGKPKEALPIEKSVNIMSDVANAIDYMHNKKSIVHRDISPANITVDDKGVVKVIDLGLGRKIGDDEDDKKVNKTMFSKVESVRGTPHYLAPEGVESSLNEEEILKYMGERDVWSVGAILYSLVAGHPPYFTLPDESIFGLIHRIANMGDRIKPLKKIRDDVPWGLSDLVSECLIKDPKLRINAAELNRGLKGVKSQL